LPNGDRAEVDLRKLTAYCLSPSHPRGRHKARVFREALGIVQADANELRSRILSAARDETAVLLDADEWGERWRVDITISRQGQRAVVRTVWIVRKGSSIPTFVACWVL
jgi:hypothetical protein